MARIEDIYQPTRDHVVELAGTPLDGEPWVSGTPLARRRVALLTTAALHRRSQARFTPGTAEHRELPSTLPAGELVSSHISINFDRSGLERDLNTIYPLDRLRELAAERTIGGVADTHYSLMGANDPAIFSATAEAIAASLARERVDALLLSPV